VVVYFYPKAFTKGCTLEAHAFAEATDDFAKAGAMVIGMSADDLPTLEKFSTMECRDKFPVAIADAAIIKNYDVLLTRPDLNATITKRTSYVIGKDGKIKLSFTDMDYKDHVSKTLATVQGWRPSADGWGRAGLTSACPAFPNWDRCKVQMGERPVVRHQRSRLFNDAR
jgi:peroxiredoxin